MIKSSAYDSEFSFVPFGKAKGSECILKCERQVVDIKINKTLRSVHFGVAVVELINCKCGGIVRNEIW